MNNVEIGSISVIIPCHNSETFINGIITDLNNQTFKKFDVIFVDDNSDKLLKDELTKFDINFKYQVVRVKCNNPGGTRNEGISHITGEYCYFIDSDDRINQNLLEYSIKAIKNYPNSQVLARKKIVQFSKPFSIKSVAYKSWKTSFDHIWFLGRTLFKSSVILNNNLRFENISHAEDVVFISEYMELANINSIINHSGIFYRVERPGSVVDHDERYISSLPILLERYYKWNKKNFHKCLIDSLSGLIDQAYEGIKKMK